jgi:hypothetical protein
VPVIMPVTGDHRRFRVEIKYDGEITREALDKIRNTAREYVTSKKITIRDEKIDVYRKR